MILPPSLPAFSPAEHPLLTPPPPPHLPSNQSQTSHLSHSHWCPHVGYNNESHSARPGDVCNDRRRFPSLLPTVHDRITLQFFFFFFFFLLLLRWMKLLLCCNTQPTPKLKNTRVRFIIHNTIWGYFSTVQLKHCNWECSDTHEKEAFLSLDLSFQVQRSPEGVSWETLQEDIPSHAWRDSVPEWHQGVT